jgi:hypothetical protein
MFSTLEAGIVCMRATVQLNIYLLSIICKRQGKVIGIGQIGASPQCAQR